MALGVVVVALGPRRPLMDVCSATKLRTGTTCACGLSVWRAEPLPSFVMAFRENELVGTKLPRQMDLHDAITLALLIRSDPNQLPSYTFGTLVPVAFQCSAEDAVILCDGF